MTKSRKKNLVTLLIAFLLLNFYSQSQTFLLREGYRGKNIDRFIMSDELSENLLSKYDSRKYVYVTNNSMYITFVPNFKNEELKLEFPNFPVFTYLRDFDLVVIKKQDKKEVLSLEEFTTKFAYKPTKEFKNYFGIKAEKHVSENSFYDCTLFVAEGETNIESNPFLNTLKELNLLQLQANQKVVAINFLGIEFDIDNLSFKRAYGRSVNEDVYFEEEVEEEDTAEKLDYVQIYNAEELNQMLNRSFTFDTEQFNLYTSNSYSIKTDTIRLLSNSKSDYKLSIRDDYFNLSSDTHFIRGTVREDGSLSPEEFYKYTDKSNRKELDFTDFKIISKHESLYKIELLMQNNKKFWDFRKYTILTNKIEDANNLKFLLPNNLSIEGRIETIESFNATYSTFDYEMVFKLSKKKELDQNQTFFIHE